MGNRLRSAVSLPSILSLLTTRPKTLEFVTTKRTTETLPMVLLQIVTIDPTSCFRWTFSAHAVNNKVTSTITEGVLTKEITLSVTLFTLPK